MVCGSFWKGFLEKTCDFFKYCGLPVYMICRWWSRVFLNKSVAHLMILEDFSWLAIVALWQGLPQHSDLKDCIEFDIEKKQVIIKYIR